MKLSELKCIACGGSVKPDPKNPGIVECEYCHSRFIVESGHGMTEVNRTPISYIPLKEPERKKDGEFRWWHGILIAVILLAAVAIMFGPQLYEKYKENKSAEENGAVSSLEENKENREKSAFKMLVEDPILSAFCEAVFAKPAEELTEADRSEIKWLEFSSDIDNWKIGYSMQSPTEHAEAKLTWFSFPRKDFKEADLSCLSAFPKLSFIGSRRTIHAEDISGLPITGIKGYFKSFEEVAQLVDNSQEITWIDITGDLKSLSGIEKFPNLETLVITGEIDDEKHLVQASALKSLTLDLGDGNMDFDTVAMIPGLESLSVACENLRDITFVTKIEKLKSLHIRNGDMISVEPLKSCIKLTELTIENCDKIKDLSAIAALTDMKKLSVDLPYKCTNPDFSDLTQVEELYLESFEKVSFLTGMTKLETLVMDNCFIDDFGAFSGLTNLKNLSCTSVGGTQLDYSFIENMTGLESVDLQGTETYGDISGIFNLPALKSLNLNGMSCEINFDKIRENNSLKELSIDNLKLYKNVDVSGENGVYYVDWDNVELVENLSFFEKFKSLEKLSIKKNELTSIAFAAELYALEMIDFSENYVTDISPLSGLKNLKIIIGTDNPVSNYEVIKDTVTIFE